MRKLSVTLLGAFIAAVILGAGHAAWANAIDPGFDLLSTPSGGAILPSPFGPIPLKGVPIAPEIGLGNTDTIIRRMSGLPDGGTGIIPAEMVQLSLMSVNPVQIPGGPLVDVFVKVADPVLGEIVVTSHDAGGGLFSSRLPVVVQATAVPVGGGDPIDLGIFQDVVASTGTPWSHTPTPGYPDAANFPAGGFFITAAGINHTGPHPRNDPAFVPEPATLLLLGAGLAGLGVAARARRRSG